MIDKDIDTSNNLKVCINENKNTSQHERALKALNMINSEYTKTKVSKTINMYIRTLNKIFKSKNYISIDGWVSIIKSSFKITSLPITVLI